MNYNINTNSYSFELIQFESGFFDESISATFIIHLEGNGRYEHIKKQLETYKPTSKVYILHNKGFKKSIKPNFIDSSVKDLIDAFITIFKLMNNFLFYSY